MTHGETEARAGREKGIQPHPHDPCTEVEAEGPRAGSKTSHLCQTVPGMHCPTFPICLRFFGAGGKGGCRRPGLSFGVAMAARSSLQTWLYQQSSDGSACDRLKPRG